MTDLNAHAPWGYKLDGTPKKRPGRAPKRQYKAKKPPQKYKPKPDPFLVEFEARTAALESLSGFRDYMRKSNHLDFQFEPEPHHQVICDLTEKIGKGLIADLRKEPIPEDFLRKLLVAAPPASAKSTYFSIQLPIWLLCVFPTLRILCVANTQTRSEDFNRRRRSAVATDEFQRLSGTTLDPDNKGVARFGTTAGGFIAAVGAGSAIAGIRADIIISDDLVASFEEASSRDQLDKLFDYYLADVRTRADSPNTPELIIGTRWSAFDPIGRFLELTEQGHEQWEHLCIPLIAGPDDPVGREEGEVLWPAKFEPRLAEIQRDPAIYAALYQQNPLTSSGNFFDLDHLPIIDMAPQNATHIIASDIALSTNKGDWSVHLVAGFDENRNLTIVDVWRDRKSLDIVAEALEHLCNVYTPTMVLIDDDNASKVFRQYLFEKRISVPIMLRPTRGQDKQVRAANSRAMAQQGRIHLKRARWNHELLNELTKFPDIRHDDQVDCVALLGREAYRMAPPKKILMPEDIETGAMKVDNGRIVTRDTLGEMWNLNKPQRRW